jgi:hypothetical protein
MTSEIKAGNATNGVQITSDGTGVLEIKTGTGAGTTAMVLDASQNVGIGTSSPSVATNYKGIVIQGSTTTAGGVLQLQTIDSSYQMQIYTDNNGSTISSTGNYAMRFQTNAAERMRIDSSGNVGIGTSSPSSRLHVNASATNNSYISATAAAGAGGGILCAGNNNTAGAASFDVFQGGDNIGYVYNRANAALVFGANNTTQAAITAAGLFQFNSGFGSVATAYGCRAWVNFDGTLTGTNAPRAGGNVTSVTRNSLGNYTINFTTAMPDINYCTLVTGYSAGEVSTLRGASQFTAPTASSTRVQYINGINTSLYDPAYGNVAVFR